MTKKRRSQAKNARPYWIDGKPTWRVLPIAGAIAISGYLVWMWWPATPMTYCKAMVERGLVDDCRKDPSPPPGSRSVQFTVRSSEKDGRIAVFDDEHAYWAALKPWLEKERLAEGAHVGYGAALVAGYLPGDFDVAEREYIYQFDVEDMELVRMGQRLKWRGTLEHPVRTESCRQSPGCVEEGRCAIYPSRPDVCIAGFDRDCMTSRMCDGHHCVANVADPTSCAVLGP